MPPLQIQRLFSLSVALEHACGPWFLILPNPWLVSATGLFLSCSSCNFVPSTSADWFSAPAFAHEMVKPDLAGEISGISKLSILASLLPLVLPEQSNLRNRSCGRPTIS